MVNSFKVIEYLRKRSILDFYVFISATSVYERNNYINWPSNVLDWDSSSMYHSLNNLNQSLRLDFPISNIYVERFFLKSAINRDPYNWDLEGSKDAITFITLYHNENTKLCKEWGSFDQVNTQGCLANEVKEYEVIHPDFYKSIRIRQTNKDSNEQNILTFSGIEFYGHIQILSFSLKTSLFFNLHFLKSFFTTFII